MALCKIVALSDIKQAKNAREYRMATVTPAITSITHSNGIVEDLMLWESKRIIWGPLVKDGKTLIKADSNFSTIAVGKVYDMEMHTYRTSPFKIGERMVNKFSALCYAVESPVDVINAKLKSQGAWVIADMDGVSIAPPVWAVPELAVDKAKAVVEEPVTAQ